ncbi:single-stranded DNA-binding protein [soil metagenome]|nr:single-stranded DNA-binding protein [Gemmatimonadota bacterium]
MSRSLNKAILIGNLGSDPEIRTTGNGAKVAQFSVATSRKWTNNAGEQQEKTEWHRVVAWSKLADVVERYVKKGQQVYVEGEIQYRSYEDKDGVTKYSTEINARELMMLGGRDGGGGFGGGDAGGGRERPAAAKPGGAGAQAGAANQGGGRDYDDFQPPAYGDEDDDLPF